MLFGEIQEDVKNTKRDGRGSSGFIRTVSFQSAPIMDFNLVSLLTLLLTRRRLSNFDIQWLV
jgi:hypothetical protein